jgi:hypothetical protein
MFASTKMFMPWKNSSTLPESHKKIYCIPSNQPQAKLTPSPLSPEEFQRKLQEKEHWEEIYHYMYKGGKIG